MGEKRQDVACLRRQDVAHFAEQDVAVGLFAKNKTVLCFPHQRLVVSNWRQNGL
jgi:hypothetical protein